MNLGSRLARRLAKLAKADVLARDNRLVLVDIVYCSESEIRRHLARDTREGLIEWIITLAHWIRRVAADPGEPGE